eukprot:gnl/TRDRNA2_/TRDRNA2_127435_c0_seq3.p1 gnl/TRDRNA2_/TRDRNA2_127435_c0~~gnl/TRDRNA2_/TRDRNA2_127435_c0_seq3.p1  ORF type:complete len:649 (+),score=121.92 gnl/TRDRNA2_/TRDRNA2_127435_c0_seq3:59-2005(+)
MEASEGTPPATRRRQAKEDREPEEWEKEPLTGGEDASKTGAAPEATPPATEKMTETASAETGGTTGVPPALLALPDRLRLARRGPTLIFDGVCNLCNASMRWYYDRIQNSKKGDVYFMWAQHDDTRPLLTELGISRDDILSSWAYIEDEIVYRGSSAWFMAMQHLCQPWRLLSVLNLVPKTLREGAYGCVARNRYKLLGSSDVCQRPEPEMCKSFLHSSAPQDPRSEQPKADESFPEQRRLLVIGCGFAGLYIARALASEFAVMIVDPKDYYEFTPGILRGFAEPKHLPNLQERFSDVFQDIPVVHVQGEVVSLDEQEAQVRLIGGEQNGYVVTVSYHFCVIASGSQYGGGGLWKVTGAPGEEDQVTLEGRKAKLAGMLDELVQLEKQKGTAICVGAGLVGVELAAEIAHFLPGLKVVLADMAPKILPNMPAGAREYAQQWLLDHNVELRLGTALPRDGGQAEALGIEGPSVVLGCAGIKMRNNFAAKLDCLDPRGAIRVNHALQVLTNDPDPDDVDRMGPARARVCGSGRIFALGDCVSVDGADPPVPKEVYPAEAMAGVVVNNLRAGKTVQCLRTCPGVLSELSRKMEGMTICSLGPDDAVFVAFGMVVATGRLASFMKGQIESTKMSETRNETWGNLVWSLVPHF